MTGLKALTLAMAKAFFRDKMTMFWAVLFPLMFLILFGGVFTNMGASKQKVIELGQVKVIDSLSKEARSELDQSIEIIDSTDPEASLAALRKGQVAAVVSQEGDQVDVQYSAADQVGSAVALSVFTGLVDGANVYASGQPPTFSLHTSQVEDQSLKQIQYVTPSLLGWAVAMSATFGAAANLVGWRKSGLLRRLRLSPAPIGSVVMARVGVSVVVALVQAAIFIGLAVAAFGLQLDGWWPLAIALLVLGTLAFLSIGMLAGSVSKTEEGAVGLANFIVLPMAFLSGSFFPLDGAPSWLQFISKLLPLHYLNEGMLDVMVRGEGPAALVLPSLALLGFTAVFTVISMRLFRWDA